ncbi:MAG: class I SAM-dependent methyltransferase [Planctomycetota bacterium]|jgi:16S rRNA (guanine(1405)-N(7))-methyltransferase
MAEADWLTSDHVRALVERMAAKATRDYRVSPDEATRVVRETVAGSADCREAASKVTDPARLARTRAFRDAASRARERIYYSLRRYRRDGDGTRADVAALEGLPEDAPGPEREEAARRVMLGHASTRERLENARDFYGQVFRLAGEPRTIVDIGCGVQPLGFPFEGEGASVELYLAADRDAEAVRAVEAHARFLVPGRVRALRWDIADGWAPVMETAESAAVTGTFDLALLLKLVPVVKRQEPHLVERLAGVPARRMLITGSAESLTKRRSVRRRERGVLRRFIADAGFEIAGEIETPDEVGWMVARA